MRIDSFRWLPRSIAGFYQAAKRRRAPSKALAGYGSVKALRKPEDFAALRDAFETSVAVENSNHAAPPIGHEP